MYHNIRDSRGKFTSGQYGNFTSKSEVKRQNVGRRVPGTQTILEKVNYVAICLDESGSMDYVRNEVVNQFNKQVETLRLESKKHGIKTYLSLYKFSSSRVDALYTNRPIDTIASLHISEYSPSGGTPLRDAIGLATNNLLACPTVGVDHSCLAIVITDGEENASWHWSIADLTKRIQDCNKTDRWTFAALCPISSVGAVERLGIPRGNIQAWEATYEGTQVMGQTVRNSTVSYYGERERGQTKTLSFFSPDLSAVTATALKRNLTDQSQDFLRLSVTADSRIDEFVEKTTGNPYVVGSGLYQLTKQERVQDYKTIVVQNKTTNELYSGVQNVRNLLKLPESGTIKIRPSLYTSEYVIFVQSTAPNRKLIQGTTMLLDKSRL